jgi:hypothetical protein
MVTHHKYMMTNFNKLPVRVINVFLEKTTATNCLIDFVVRVIPQEKPS